MHQIRSLKKNIMTRINSAPQSRETFTTSVRYARVRSTVDT